MRVTRRQRVGVVLAAAVVALAGCEALTGEEPVGELAGQWSESTVGQDWVGDMAPLETALLTSVQERDAWIEALPGGADVGGVRERLGAVELDTSVIVVGGYARCTESSQVLLGGDDDAPTLRFEVTSSDPQVSCAWSPFTVDAWAVPLDATDGVVPVLETDDDGTDGTDGTDDGGTDDGGTDDGAAEPAGTGDPDGLVPVGTLLDTWDENDAQRDALDEIATAFPIVTEATERDALADALEAALTAVADPDDEGDAERAARAADLVRAVDMEESAIVLAGYPRCTESSVVLGDPDRLPAEVSVRIVDSDPQTVCEWSPFTLDVWVVDLADVGGDIEESSDG